MAMAPRPRPPAIGKVTPHQASMPKRPTTSTAAVHARIRVLSRPRQTSAVRRPSNVRDRIHAGRSTRVISGPFPCPNGSRIWASLLTASGTTFLGSRMLSRLQTQTLLWAMGRTRSTLRPMAMVRGPDRARRIAQSALRHGVGADICLLPLEGRRTRCLTFMKNMDRGSPGLRKLEPGTSTRAG